MERILACVDLSPVTERILRHAAHLASRLDAELVVLHVAPAEPEWVGWGPGPQTVRDEVACRLRETHRRVQALGDALRAEGLSRVKALAVQGPTPETILEMTERLDASMLVLGAHRRGPIHVLFVGSVARQVLRRAERPVLIVPEQRG